jgi:hypothetical protein
MEFYNQQLKKALSGERFDSASDVIKAWGVKPGKFAEDTIVEILGISIERASEFCRIDQGSGRFYLSDGFIPSLDVHLESKFQAFCSTGTASEKLPMFLIKAAGYDKKVLLVLGGDLEVPNRDKTASMMRKAYLNPSSCQTGSELAMLSLVEMVRPKIAGIVGLSELLDWFRAALQVPR